VLNPQTGLVLPQWYVKCNNNFDMINLHAVDPTNGHWKCMAGLITIKGETIPGKLGGMVSKASQLIPPLKSPILSDSGGDAGLQGASPSQGAMLDDFDDPDFAFNDAKQDGSTSIGNPLQSVQE
jgi:hypothetical protein